MIDKLNKLWNYKTKTLFVGVALIVFSPLYLNKTLLKLKVLYNDVIGHYINK